MFVVGFALSTYRMSLEGTSWVVMGRADEVMYSGVGVEK
jgi:hypothetical protein